MSEAYPIPTFFLKLSMTVLVASKVKSELIHLYVIILNIQVLNF